jgi:hypothetical protein
MPTASAYIRTLTDVLPQNSNSLLQKRVYKEGMAAPISNLHAICGMIAVPSVPTRYPLGGPLTKSGRFGEQKQKPSSRPQIKFGPPASSLGTKLTELPVSAHLRFINLEKYRIIS